MQVPRSASQNEMKMTTRPLVAKSVLASVILSHLVGNYIIPTVSFLPLLVGNKGITLFRTLATNK